jgi:alpha-tubulin suppressor-like RCC1 family protein
LETASVVSVANVAALPSAADNKGRFFFVQDVCGHRYSDGVSWTDEYYTGVGVATLVYTWGLNSQGQLGTNTITCRSSPGTVAGTIITWCGVSIGSNHTAAVKTDGTAWSWGYNGQGQLGDGTVTLKSAPGQVAGLNSNWCQISAGGFNTAAVKTDGTAWTWGINTSGQLGDGTITGRSSPGTTAGGGTSWCEISAGGGHTAAVKTDGTAWTWGVNTWGQLGNNSTTARCSPVTTVGGGTTWCQISAGACHTAAIKTDGTAWAWGDNCRGKLGNGLITSRISPVLTCGGGTTWCQISAGGTHTAAVKTDGTAWTWGSNVCGVSTAAGQLGTGNLIERCSPVTTAGAGTTWCQISAGNSHTAAMKTDSTAWTWGSNQFGQIGNNSVAARCSPGTTSGGGTTWCKIDAGDSHTAALAICTQPIFSEPL